ncbi:MAG: hypothetical protein ACI4HQ_05845 [Acetatifactor sp.]
MTCPNCGGEFSSQEIKCPFCGSGNPEGIAFQNEVREKIERNKLLKPFLIKQKTPELAQRMLTRILLIMVGVNVLLLAFSLGIYLWSTYAKERQAAPGSFAESYMTLHTPDSYYYMSFLEDMYKFMDDLDNGQIPDEEHMVQLLKSGYEAIARSAELTPEEREEIEGMVRAFFRGYLEMREEELAFLQPGEEGGNSYGTPEEQELRKTAKNVIDRLEEAER